MPSMMIAVSPKTPRKRSLSWVLKPLMWASIRVWITAGGLLVTITLRGRIHQEWTTATAATNRPNNAPSQLTVGHGQSGRIRDASQSHTRMNVANNYALVQLGPDVRTGAGSQQAYGLAAAAQRQHEQPRASILTALR